MKTLNDFVDISGRRLMRMPRRPDRSWLFSDVRVMNFFSCADNLLTSLDGSPTEVLNDFYCHENELTSFSGIPKMIGGALIADTNKITSLANLFGVRISGGIDVSNNELRSLEGSPEIVHGTFNCENNQLRNLIGAPAVIYKDFYCSFNLLTSLEGCPKKVHGNFYCTNNPVRFKPSEIRRICQVRGRIFVHDHI